MQPVNQWNVGKQQEFAERKVYDADKALGDDMEAVTDFGGAVNWKHRTIGGRGVTARAMEGE